MTIEYNDPASILGEFVDEDGERRGTLGEFAGDDSGRPDYVSAVVRELLDDGLAFVPMEPPCNCKNWVSTSLSCPLHLVSEAAMTAD